MKKLAAVSAKLFLSGAVLLAGASLWAQEAAQTTGWDPSSSREPKFGAGLILGNPSGLTAKYRLSKIHAIDGGIGFGGDLAIYGDYIWHGWRVFPQPEKGKLAGYLGLGGRIEFKDVRDDELGVRFVGGVGYWLPKLPMEIFLELVPLLRVAPSSNLGLDLGLGFRYYFKSFN